MPYPLSRVVALALFAAVLAAPAVVAQDVAPAAPAPTDFEEAELNAFAEAYIGIEDLQMRYQAEYGEIADPDEMQQVQERFQVDAAEVIEDAGMTVERYEQVIMATQTDPDFAQDVIERVENVRAERAG